MSARRRVLLGTAALVAVRLLLSAWRPGPVILGDEIGYLTNARVLAGGVPAELLDTPFYHGGYSLLIAPLLALFDDPVAAYRLALVLNALLAAALFPLLYALLTQAFRVPGNLALWPALAAAAYPAVTPTTGTAMSENLLFPLTVAWLLAFAKLLDAGSERVRAAWAACFGVVAAALWAAHGRMLVAVVLSALALLVLAVRGRLSARSAAAAGATLAASVLGARALNAYLVERNYGGRDLDEARTRLEAISGFDDLVTIAGNAIGQTWYLLVATLGLALVVPSRRWGGGTPAAVLALLLLAAVGLIGVSALSFPDVERADMLVYGRYVEVVAPPLVAIGLASLALARGRAAIRPLVAILLALSLAVAALRAELEPPQPASFWNVLALPLRSDGLGTASLLAAGLAVCGVVLVLVWVARRRPQLLAPLLLLMFIPTTALAQRQLQQRSDAVYPPGWASLPHEGIRRIAYDERRPTFDGKFIYPWFASDSVVVGSRRRLPPGHFVISSSDWSREHPAIGAVARWTDPARDQTLWEIRPPHDQAALIRRCLEVHGIESRPADESPRGGVTLRVGAATATPAHVVVFSTSSAASAYAAQVERLVDAVGRGRGTSVMVRDDALAIDRGDAPARQRDALVRCL